LSEDGQKARAAAGSSESGCRLDTSRMRFSGTVFQYVLCNRKDLPLVGYGNISDCRTPVLVRVTHELKDQFEGILFTAMLPTTVCFFHLVLMLKYVIGWWLNLIW
jgi:hypothetical protein